MQSVSKTKISNYKRPSALKFSKNEPDFSTQNFVQDIGKANPLFLNRNSMNPHQCFSGKANPLLQVFHWKSEHEKAPPFPLFLGCGNFIVSF